MRKYLSKKSSPSVYRKWGLAKRLEHRRVQGKQKKKTKKGQ